MHLRKGACTYSVHFHIVLCVSRLTLNWLDRTAYHITKAFLQGVYPPSHVLAEAIAIDVHALAVAVSCASLPASFHRCYELRVSVFTRRSISFARQLISQHTSHHIYAITVICIELSKVGIVNSKQ